MGWGGIGDGVSVNVRVRVWVWVQVWAWVWVGIVRGRIFVRSMCGPETNGPIRNNTEMASERNKT